jgi:hypothetical protein
LVWNAFFYYSYLVNWWVWNMMCLTFIVPVDCFIWNMVRLTFIPVKCLVWNIVHPIFILVDCLVWNMVCLVFILLINSWFYSHQFEYLTPHQQCKNQISCKTFIWCVYITCLEEVYEISFTNRLEQIAMKFVTVILNCELCIIHPKSM